MREAVLQFPCMQSRFGGQLGTQGTDCLRQTSAVAEHMACWCHKRMVLKIMHTFLIGVEECYLHVIRALCYACGQHIPTHNTASTTCITAINGIPRRRRR
jgi:hypothetical protein